MTASSPASASSPAVVQASSSNSGSSSAGNHGKQSKSQRLHSQQPQPQQQQNQSNTTGVHQSATSSIQASCPSFNSSVAFQQVKQTQASLARLCRVHHQQQSQSTTTSSQASNPSSQQQLAKLSLDSTGQMQQQPQQPQQQKPTTFVDCLIRRFENCFDEDFCAVPMFVVGGLSPGSDGTHLILPPCVSLGGQNINRFSSPKNLRLMNSIRESCRSIEELDLGHNKLTDLIEVYKILQCTPNLRFLNLSENDLSRSSPVAMASQSPASSSAIASSFATSSPTNVHHQHHHLNQQRAYLAPINQNQQHGSLLGARRHSSLGQSSGQSRSTPGHQSTRISSASTSASSLASTRTRQTGSRVAEARRLAAANALAQSKKTSPIVASKLANSAAAAQGSLSRQASGSCRALAARCDDSNSLLLGKQTRAVAGQRKQTSSASTMHLARSLSSLSAKDIRAATGSSSSRLAAAAAHRSSLRNESVARSLAANRRSSFGSSSQEAHKVASSLPSTEGTKTSTTTKITTSTSHQKLYAEPIVENEDVEMTGGEQQQQLSSSGSSSVAPSSGANQQITVTQSSNISPSPSIQQPQQLQSKTGNQSLRSYCNSHLSLLGLGVNSSNNNQQTTTNFRRTFGSVKALALNNTGCQWKVVCSILSRMPNLEELHLSLNNYEKIDLDTNQFKHHSLKRLYLCNNPKLTNWEELDKLLIAFPSLEALSIADCNISQIPDNLAAAREWRKLCGLNINGWPIKEWPVVERLNQLPSLIDLRCRNLAVLNSIDEPRPHLIARLPKLLRLNGSEIEEREDAEKAFLRFFLVNAHLERPPRFHELMQVYGEVPHIDVDVDLSPPSQASIKIIYLNRNHYRKADEDDVLMSEDFLLKLMDDIEANNPLTSGSGGGGAQENMDVVVASESSASAPIDSGPVRLFKDEGQEVVALDVDLRQSVRKFKSTIASLFGLDSANLILYYIDHEMVGLMGPELIKHNQKKLWNYNVQDGDQFIVEDR